jgi:hypothetical protein
MLEYAIVDFQNRQLVVIAEETTRESAEKALARIKNDKCEVYREVGNGGEVFRIICEQESVVADDPVRTKR